MNSPKGVVRLSNLWFLFVFPILVLAAGVLVLPFQAANEKAAVATYAKGTLHVSVPYRGAHTGTGKLILEVLDPEDQVLGHVERRAVVPEKDGQWEEDIALENSLSLEDLAWHRLRYRFEYEDRSRFPRSFELPWCTSLASNPICRAARRRCG
jgi:hypothetical protein